MVSPELSCFAWTVLRKMTNVQIQTVWSNPDQRQKLPCPRVQGKYSARWHARWTPSPSGSGSVRVLQPGNFLRLPPPPIHPCWRSQTSRRLGDQGGHSGPWSSSSANPFRKLQVHVTEELQEVWVEDVRVEYVPELPPKTKKPEYVHHPSLPLVSKYRQGTESVHDDTR